jgi:hypothetical protein
LARLDLGTRQEGTAMAAKAHAPDMRYPDKTDANKAAEKEIGEAQFTRAERQPDAASRGEPDEGTGRRQTARL